MRFPNRRKNPDIEKSAGKISPNPSNVLYKIIIETNYPSTASYWERGVTNTLPLTAKVFLAKTCPELWINLTPRIANPL